MSIKSMTKTRYMNERAIEADVVFDWSLFRTFRIIPKEFVENLYAVIVGKHTNSSVVAEKPRDAAYHLKIFVTQFT